MQVKWESGKYGRIWRGWQELCPCNGLLGAVQCLSVQVSSQLVCHRTWRGAGCTQPGDAGSSVPICPFSALPAHPHSLSLPLCHSERLTTEG